MSTLMPTLIATPPSPSPHPAPSAATCVPGRDGIPNSIIGHLMCGSWADDAPATMAVFVRAHWPLLLAGLVALAAVRLGWAWWRRRV